MSAIAFKVNRNGDIEGTVVPAREEPHFGVLDGAIVAFILFCASGLIYLLAQG